MTKHLLLILSLILMSIGMAFGQEVPENVQSIGDKILAFLASAEGASVAIALGLEFVLRLFPSKKPLGILRMVIVVGRYVCSIVLQVLEFLDNVLPQNVEEKPLLKGLK